MNTRIDMVKHITPVLTHDGRILARFSDRNTARRMAAAWGGCVVGPTHTDPGKLTPDHRAPFGYRRPAAIPARYVHPDPVRQVESARVALNLPVWAVIRSGTREWFVGCTESAEGDGGYLRPVGDGMWYAGVAVNGSDRDQPFTVLDGAYAAMRALYLR